MGTDCSNHDYRFLLPWFIGAWVWGIVSYVVLSEYKKIGDPQYLGEICFVLSLLWAEFGFAAILKEVYSRRYRHLAAYAAIIVLPPLVMYILMVL